jgi:hypothetical protein
MNSGRRKLSSAFMAFYSASHILGHAKASGASRISLPAFEVMTMTVFSK